MKESVSSQKDVALEEMTTPTAREAREQARRKTLENVEELCELSRALAVLASASVRIGSNLTFLTLVQAIITFLFLILVFTQDSLFAFRLLILVSKQGA